MRTYIGIVCEKSKNEMIFMTNEGEFLRGIPLVANPEIGDEVEFQLAATSPLRSKRKSTIIWPALVASVFLIFLVSSFIPQTENAYAYVQLGNEIELGLDEEGNVLFVNTLNKEETVEVDELEGLPINIALSKVAREVSPSNEEIEITTKYVKQNNKELKETIDRAVNEVRNVQYEKSTPINQNIPKEKTKTNHGKTTQNNKVEEKQQPPMVEQKINEKQLEKSTNNHSTEEQPDNLNQSNETNKTNDKQGKSNEHIKEPNPNSEMQKKKENEKLVDEKTNQKSAASQNNNKNESSNNHRVEGKIE